jgi:hypothetical protein
MDVNFDGLRKRLIRDYNSLVNKMNNKINNNDGEVQIDVDYISRELDGIRDGLVTLAFIYLDGPDGFETLDENTHFECFNPIDDE